MTDKEPNLSVKHNVCNAVDLVLRMRYLLYNVNVSRQSLVFITCGIRLRSQARVPFCIITSNWQLFSSDENTSHNADKAGL